MDASAVGAHNVGFDAMGAIFGSVHMDVGLNNL